MKHRIVGKIASDEIKRRGGKESWPVLRHYTIISLEGQRKTMKESL